MAPRTDRSARPAPPNRRPSGRAASPGRSTPRNSELKRTRSRTPWQAVDRRRLGQSSEDRQQERAPASAPPGARPSGCRRARRGCARRVDALMSARDLREARASASAVLLLHQAEQIAVRVRQHHEVGVGAIAQGMPKRAETQQAFDFQLAVARVQVQVQPAAPARARLGHAFRRNVRARARRIAKHDPASLADSLGT